MEPTNTNPQSATPPVSPAPAAAPVNGAPKGLAIAAMIVGIVALLFSALGLFNLLTAIVAVVLSIIALVKHQPKGFALTGLITGAIALIISLIVGLVLGAAFLKGLSEGATQSSTSSSNSSQSTDSMSSGTWDYETAYNKINTGMTKAEVEEVTGKKSTSCSEFNSEAFGKSETCSYGDSLTDKAVISVTYDDGVVSTKYKYTY